MFSTSQLAAVASTPVDGELLAGYEITAYQIGNVAYTLATRPDLVSDLTERPEILEQAVEELLRQIPLTAAAFYPRVATEDVELGGTTVHAGEAVLASMTSANHDESVYRDADAIDFDREAAAHLAFSYGIHHCLGAQLARMELHVERQLPDLPLSRPSPVRRRGAGTVA